MNKIMKPFKPRTNQIVRIIHKGLLRIYVLFIGIVFYGALATSHFAVAQPMHDTHDMGHGQTTACITLCTPTTPRNDSPTFEDDNEDNQKNAMYLQTSSREMTSALSIRHGEIARAVDDFEPPPGSPAYIALSVFRS